MVDVSGTVQFDDGTPLETGSVFLGDGKMMYYGEIQPGGRFSVGVQKDGQGIPVGKYRVWLAVNTSGYGPDGKVFEKILIDPKYESAESSGLTVVVKKGGTKPLNITVEKP